MTGFRIFFPNKLVNGVSGGYMKKYSILALVFLVMMSCVSLNPVFAAALKLGMESDEVYTIQSRLLEYGYLSESADGKYGPNTQEAVIRFQLDYGLEPDGIVGEATKQLLLSGRAQGGVSRAVVDNRKGQQIVSFAKKFLGVPYAWAGRSPNGFDCSGFTSYIFGQNNITIPRMADEQFEVGLPVKKSDLMLGDMVFFSTYEPGPSHVGIYIGNGQFIHASSGADEVTVTPLNKPYYVERYVGARRVIK